MVDENNEGEPDDALGSRSLLATAIGMLGAFIMACTFALAIGVTAASAAAPSHFDTKQYVPSYAVMVGMALTCFVVAGLIAPKQLQALAALWGKLA